jgi:hypothetical protein
LETQHPQRPSRGTCTVEGCTTIDRGPDGLCAKHQTRVRRHGDVDAKLSPVHHRGPTHQSWLGDDITYSGMHDRLRRWRGSASQHRCADCGNQAKQWSYDHADPNEKQSEEGPYSAKTAHYVPRCVRCHKAYDLSFLAG